MIFFHFTLLLFFTLIIHTYIYPTSKKLILKIKIRNRIKNNSYILNFQPIVNPTTKEIISFEALTRLKNKKDEIIPPIMFLDKITYSGMMPEFNLWVLKGALSHYEIIKNYSNMKNIRFYLSVNVSPKELEDNKFINKLTKISNDFERHTICLEITENENITDFSKLKSSVNKLRSMGYLIALDDFGAHYSNLDLLEALDYDILKLDKQFLDNIPTSEFNQEILKFVSKMCTMKNIKLIIEGIETEEQKNFVMNILNDNYNYYFQGYYYSKPVKLEDIQLLNFT